MEILILKRTKVLREKSTSDKGHYVKNSELLPAVLRAKQKDEITEELITMIWKIAERYSHSYKFSGYSYRKDMVSAAVENLIRKKNALKFNDQLYSNPFSFYTTAINNSFLQFLGDEKKQRNIRDKLIIKNGENPSFNFSDRADDGKITESDDIKLEHLKFIESLEEADSLSTQEKIQDEAKKPGEVRRYGPDDFIVDPITGNITIKPEAIARYEVKPEPVIEVEVKAKKPRKKTLPVKVKKNIVSSEKTSKEKSSSKKVAVKKTPVKKTPAKKTVTKKTPAKKTPVKKTPVKKTPAKKTVTKKTPAKKTPAKKTVTKKTPTKKVESAKTTRVVKR